MHSVPLHDVEIHALRLAGIVEQGIQSSANGVMSVSIYCWTSGQEAYAYLILP